MENYIENMIYKYEIRDQQAKILQKKVEKKRKIFSKLPSLIVV
jgi:hypothetical protein